MSTAREEASPPLTVLLVEDNPGDARLIRELGCDEGQGFGLARPMGAENLGRWLAANPEL